MVMEVPRRPPLADDLTICGSDISRRNHTTREGGGGAYLVVESTVILKGGVVGLSVVPVTAS